MVESALFPLNAIPVCGLSAGLDRKGERFGSCPLFAELPEDERHIQTSVANSYLADLADYLIRKGKWINKREQKPPLDTPVLLFVRYKYGSVIYIGEYVLPTHYKKRLVFATNIRRDKDGMIIDGFPLKETTHWMPLPEPPPTRRMLK